MFEEIKEQIKVVVEARQKAAKAHLAKDTAYQQWQDEHQDLIEAAMLARSKLDEEENLLRELTLNAFNQTGDKTLIPGVGIRIMTKLEYYPRVAFKWAVEHNMALSLDTRAFEKIAKASPPDFVTINQVPQATIATELKED